MNLQFTLFFDISNKNSFTQKEKSKTIGLFISNFLLHSRFTKSEYLVEKKNIGQIRLPVYVG